MLHALLLVQRASSSAWSLKLWLLILILPGYDVLQAEMEVAKEI